MDNELNLGEVIIGNYEQWQIYHIEKINGNFFNSNETHICKKCKKARY